MEVQGFFTNSLIKVFTHVALFFCLFLSPTEIFASFEDDVFTRLDRVRTQKKEQIRHLFDALRVKAEGVRSDKVMQDFFFFMEGLNHQGLLRPGAKISPDLSELVDEYSKTVDQYYLSRYLDFYDIMFVDKGGDIFYTILKEGDFRSNLFSDPLSDTTLSQLLRAKTSTFFVDYQYYLPADEPAAFFVEPIVRNGEHEGWIVMQYAINKINAMMVDCRELGETGEVYLVNRQHYILNNSRYSPEETSLRLRIDNPQVKKAFEGKPGHMVVRGYRGVRVFSSYESFALWGAQWALVVSIDEDEVITDNFLKNQAKVSPAIFSRLSDQTQSVRREKIPVGRRMKVDMDEVIKGKPNEMLHTRGVSTCTAVVATFPGRFAYLGHVSPLDKIYGEEKLTNRLKDMVNRIKYYDIHLYEMRNLRFVVVANHLESISNIIRKLTKYGIQLSQITFAYNPGAHYANVTSEVKGGETFVEWIYDDDDGVSTVQKASEIEDLSVEYKKAVNYRY